MIKPTKEFIEIFKKTNGALSVCESIAIMNIAAQAPEGLYMELGSYKGKSAMSAAYALKYGGFYLVDPLFESEDIWKEIDYKMREVCNHTVVPVFINDISLNEITEHDEYSYVFVDSGLHDDMVMEEVKLLEDKIVPNGIVAFHDYLNQFTAVQRAYNYLISTGKYDEINIDWVTIINYVKERNLEEGNNSWHIYEDNPFPNFVGALKRK